MNENVLVHFSKEETVFVKKILSYKKQSEAGERFVLTSFLDPREQEIIKMIFGKNDQFKYAFDGFVDTSERKRCFIYPSFYELDKDDYNLVCYSFKFNPKYFKVSHPKVLGKLLSMGINKEHIGDIYVLEDTVYFIVSKSISSYIENELSQLGKLKISLKVETDIKLTFKSENSTRILHSKSNRLDALVSAISKKSRNISKELILSKAIKINHKVVTNISETIKNGDLISIRKFGRVNLIDIKEKRNKKGYIVEIGSET